MQIIMDINQTEEEKHTFTWKISNVSFLTQEKGECIESPVFTVKNLNETSWYLLFYPRGDEEDSDMSCYLRRSENCSGPSEIECEYRFQLFRANKLYFSSEPNFIQFDKGYENGIDINPKEELWNDSHSLDDTLTIHCDLNTIRRDPVLRSGYIELTKVDTDQFSIKLVVKNINTTCIETVKLPYAGGSYYEITVKAPGDDIEISIVRKGSTSLQYVMCRMSLLDLQGSERDSKQAARLFEAETGSESWQFPTFLKKSKLNSEKEKYIEDDSFTLKCEVSVSNGKVTNIKENKNECGSKIVDFKPCIDNIHSLKADIASMYVNKSQTDVQLIVGRKVFPVHKFILSARSPVFMTMFNQDMVENKSGQVDISDLEPEILDFLLEYMYTGSVKKMDCGKATKLLLAADKYQVLTLKQEVSTFLQSALADSSICDVLATADLVEDKPLRVAAVNYIKKRSKKILKSVEWKGLVVKNLTLATDVICEISTLFADDRE